VQKWLNVQCKSTGPSLTKAILDIFLFFKALMLTRSRQYDYAHCIEDAGIIGAFLKKFRGYQFAYEKHSDAAAYRGGFLRNLALRLYEQIEAVAIQHADVIFTGRGLVSQIRAIDSTARIQTVDNIPTSRVEPCESRAKEIRARLGLTEDELLLTYMGTFASYQGVDLLFEAIPIVVQQAQGARFLIVGGNEGEIAEKKRWLSSRGVLHAATFLRPIHPDEVPHYLAASDILLAPRRAGRTIGTKIFDYAKAGRAIVATNHTSNRKMLDASSGLLTPPTPEAFAEGILRLMGDPVLRERLAGNVRRILEGRYDYESFKQRMKSGYAMMESLAGDD
jgi:glycosyltransferase involved in cell wall biosynthesis